MSEVRPDSKTWAIMSKITGLVVGATLGTMLSPNPQAPIYASSIATF